MNPTEKESILTVALMAGFADGVKNDAERAELKRIAQSLPQDGVVSDRWKNLAFKAPKQSTLYPNLFFVGGSVNPGGGMPMVVLCGQNVARKIVAWDM